jgi:hypothetical protein
MSAKSTTKKPKNSAPAPSRHAELIGDYQIGEPGSVCIDTDAAAEIWRSIAGIGSHWALKKYRKTGEGPPYFRVGGKFVRYMHSENHARSPLVRWIAQAHNGVARSFDEELSRRNTMKMNPALVGPGLKRTARAS